jgi:ascorbate-specific PTS system EIIC-type component UlaA
MKLDKRLKFLNDSIVIVVILILIMLVAIANVDTIVKYIK